MGHFLTPLQGPVHEEHEDNDSDGAQGRNNADDSILTRLASIRGGTALVTTTSTAWRTTSVGVRHGSERETAVNVLCEGTGDLVGSSSVEARVLGLDERRQLVHHVRRDVAEPHSAKVRRVRRRPIRRGDVDLQSICLDSRGINFQSVRDQNRDPSKQLGRTPRIPNNKRPVERRAEQDGDEGQAFQIGVGRKAVDGVNLVGQASGQRSDTERRRSSGRKLR